MEIIQNISLKNLTTMHVDAKASKMCIVSEREELKTMMDDILENWMVIGEGSNILFLNDYDGNLIQIDNQTLSFLEEDETSIIINVGAGYNWHEFVKYCIQNGFGGIENLALIPGNVGASPIQNIGAYGVEVSDCITRVEVFDTKLNEFKYLDNEQCKFQYRDSIFKQERNRYIIWSVDYKLSKPLFHQIKISYKPLKEWFLDSKLSDISIKNVFEAVIAIRSSKLPDPNEIGNNGSFFKNPIISSDWYNKLLIDFPNIPGFSMDNNSVKIPAAWLIEHCGWKGYRDGDIGVYPKHALVLVNYGNAKKEDFKKLINNIQQSVQEKFRIQLVPEVNIIQ